ncbi:permease [Klenkia sp. PcliD-1-E]|uniref:permease n=1 Tax=Klenkia sp. PcliD-1-E TaxID=2954492 RepID=UPI002096862D|nr:permease [Klenkia sp. PcliD-1-E]MCO7220646.1 permease [Klenkia sp. PcliD-1-E]
MSTTEQPATTDRRRLWLLGGIAVALLVVGLWWAKYGPYAGKVPAVVGSHDLGASIITGGDRTAPPVSLAAGWDFTVAYTAAIWKALVVGLVLAAAVQVLLPASWLRRVLGGPDAGTARGGLRGGLASVPTLMCSCCAAPLAVGLRRARAGTGAVLAFWLSNPALNPVVLVFCLAVLPWPWAVLRFGAGLAVVVAAVGLAAVLTRSHAVDEAALVEAPDVPADPRPLPARFLATLVGLSTRLLPEYLAVVFVLGVFRGVLFPADAGAGASAVVVLLLLLVAGIALPVPTGGEVAVVAAALAAGLAAPAAAVLLVTLPVLSLPSLLMVRHVFPGRLLLGTTGVVAGVALLGAGATAALTG